MYEAKLLVTTDQARQMCVGLVDGLSSVLWEDELGMALPDWDTFVDRAVYDKLSGLRMIGCPKASKCATCHNKNLLMSCGFCSRQNGNFIVEFGKIVHSGNDVESGINTRVFEVNATSYVEGPSADMIQASMEMPRAYWVDGQYRSLPRSSIAGESAVPPFAISRR